MNEPAQKRPEFRNIHLFSDIPTYRLPLAALVSILHRVSGLLMFLLLPLIIWLFDKSVSSEISFGTFRAAFASGLGIVPAWLLKLVVLALIWSYLHHLFAGVRHLWMDVTHHTTKEFGRQTALATLVAAVVLTLALGAKLFGLY
ncbi:succinate dehydrogenase, cytochrome b556 subunit [Melaminivora sp.]|uniref:succinate dehydrogenase, cytochrome b556 subunit n=1 Tax=Melaminivora sp. TaxID=1933032 RepID=UPI0028B1EBBF|nr:succinate dehydrogenase, cytochrome b556 subunit [Melaminivora sp.]